MARSVGVQHVDPHSDYIEAIYAAHVDDAVEAARSKVAALELAGKWEDAKGLAEFFGSCSLERFLGDDEACRKETVRAAIGWGRFGGIPHSKPLTGALAGKAAGAVALSVPEHFDLSQMIPDLDRIASEYRIDHRAVEELRGAYPIIAVKNTSPWVVTSVETDLDLPAPIANPPVHAHCHLTILQFLHPDGVPPGGTLYTRCIIPERAISPAALAEAIRRAQESGTPFLHAAFIGLKDPPVNIGVDSTGRFEVTPQLSSLFDSTGGQASADVKREIGQLDCKTTRSCPPMLNAVSLPAYNASGSHPAVLVSVAGLLIGVAVGALSRRPVRRALQWAGLLVASVVAFVALLVILLASSSREIGFAGMAVGGLSYAAIMGTLIGIPCFAIGVAIMVAFRPEADASSVPNS
jgi:hypothetical protein